MAMAMAMEGEGEASVRENLLIGEVPALARGEEWRRREDTTGSSWAGRHIGRQPGVRGFSNWISFKLILYIQLSQLFQPTATVATSW